MTLTRHIEESIPPSIFQSLMKIIFQSSLNTYKNIVTYIVRIFVFSSITTLQNKRNVKTYIKYLLNLTTNKAKLFMSNKALRERVSVTQEIFVWNVRLNLHTLVTQHTDALGILQYILLRCERQQSKILFMPMCEGLYFFERFTQNKTTGYGLEPVAGFLVFNY